MKTKRISYIDIAKGLGILLVVFGHTGFATESQLTWISSFHMPLFFVLSGMLLSHTGAHEVSMASILQKKARSILIPYGTFSVLSILFSAVLDSGTFASYLPNALLQTFTFYGISVLWFLPALFFAEIIFLFIRKRTSLPICALLSALICLIASFSANTYHYHYVVDFESNLSLLGAYLIAVWVRTGVGVTFLALGYFSHHLFFRKKYATPVYLGMALFFFVLNFALGSQNGYVDLNYMLFHNYGLFYSAAYCGSMFLISLSAALPAWKPLLTIGRNSLIIMVTHMNCRLLGVSYAIGNLGRSLLPVIGEAGYQIITLVALACLEAVAVYGINHYAPFLIGAKKKARFQVCK